MQTTSIASQLKARIHRTLWRGKPPAPEASTLFDLDGVVAEVLRFHFYNSKAFGIPIEMPPDDFLIEEIRLMTRESA